MVLSGLWRLERLGVHSRTYHYPAKGWRSLCVSTRGTERGTPRNDHRAGSSAPIARSLSVPLSHYGARFSSCTAGAVHTWHSCDFMLSKRLDCREFLQLVQYEVLGIERLL